MKPKKIPIRTCVITKEARPKSELTRVVVNKDGIVSVDTKGKMPGRGAYLLLTKEVIEKAKKTKALERALEISIPDSVYDDLIKLIHE